MKVFLPALLTLAMQVVGQDMFDDLLGLGVNTNLPNPAVVVIMRPPVLDVKTLSLNTLQLGLFEAMLLDAGMLTLTTKSYGWSPDMLTPGTTTYGTATYGWSPDTLDINGSRWRGSDPQVMSPSIVTYGGIAQKKTTPKLFRTNSSKLTERIKEYSDAGVAGISPNLYSNLKAWVDASKLVSTINTVSFDAKGLRAIAEISAPNTIEESTNQTAELAWAKSQGYNAALVVWRGESPLALSGIAAGLKADGWRVLFAYSPNEGNQFTATPTQIKEAASLILPYCDAALLGWRASSIPHFNGAMKVYADIVAKAYRDAAPNIPLIGEWFFKKESENLRFKGKSGTLIVNISHQGIKAAPLSEHLIKANIKEPYIVLVVGAKAYYDTTRSIPGYTISQAVTDKQAIETELLKGGFATITLVGDGYGERAFNGVQKSDSLTRSQLRNAIK